MGVLTKYVFLSGRRDSNPQQPAWKAGTLPIELLPQVVTNLGYPSHFFTWKRGSILLTPWVHFIKRLFS